MIKKIGVFLKKHYVWSGVIVVVLVGAGWWYRSKNSTATTPQYITAAVTRGTLTTSVSGSGQVSASSQIDLKPEVSGRVISVAVHPGDQVKQGQLLAQLNAGDAYKSVRDAQLSLESAQLSLKKVVQPADALSMTQAENALTTAQQNKAAAEADLAKDYDNAFNTISNAFLDLPAVMSGVNDILFGSSMGTVQWNIGFYADNIGLYDVRGTPLANQLHSTYDVARAKYDANFNDYKAASRFSERTVTLALLDQTYQTTKSIADVLKNTNDFIQLYVDTATSHGLKVSAQATAHLNTLAGYNSKINADLSALLSARQAIDTDVQTISNSAGTITERTQSLEKLRTGTDPLDVESAQLSVRQRQVALADAQQNLAKYALRAPLAGAVATVNLVTGDQANSGSSAITIVSPQQLAQITLNEVDVAKISKGQKATLTFDALGDLTLTGTVADIDGIGTVSQGVVSYGVKIVFDTTDARIKPGMSVSAAIITSVHTNVLVVPTSAITSGASAQSGTVQVLVNGQPAVRTVTVGASNDTESEVSGDIREGEEVVTQTIQATKATSANTSGGLPFLSGAGGTRAITGGTIRATGATNVGR